MLHRKFITYNFRTNHSRGVVRNLPKMTEYERKQKQRLKQSKLILLIGILLVIIAPYVLTRNFGILSFDETGQIGDTIGGITAPIVNLIGAVLVYFAFLVQLDANQLIFQQIKEEKSEQKINQNRNYVFEIFKLLKEELYSFSITEEKRIGRSSSETTVMVEYKGLEAIEKMLYNLMHDHEGFGSEVYKLKEFQNIIELFKKFLTTLKETQLNQIDKKYFLESVEYMYTSKIKSSLEELIKPCDDCGKIHNGDPTKLNELSAGIESIIEEIKKATHNNGYN